MADNGYTLDIKIHVFGWNFLPPRRPSQGDVFGAVGATKVPGRIAANLTESKTGQLQFPRSNWHRGQAISWRALWHRFRTFAAHPTEQLTRRARATAN